MAVNLFKWDTKTPPSGFTRRLRDISYTSNASLGKYCAVGDRGKIITSADGNTWVEQTSGFSGRYFLGIETNNSIWVAVGGDRYLGTPGAIYTSSNGTSWTSRTLSVNTLYLWRVLWTGTNFITCGVGGVLGTSPDGITWTSRTVPGAGSNDTLYMLAINDSNRVVLADNNGRIWYSDDHGVTWARSNSPLNDDAQQLRNLAWNGSYFIATAVGAHKDLFYSGCTGQDMMVSSDGYSWQKETTFGKQGLIIHPIFYTVAGNGSGETMFCGQSGCSYTGSGSIGSISWTERDRAEITIGSYVRGSCYDGSSYFVVGDDAFIAKGSYNNYTIATNPDPMDQVYGKRGSNVTPTTAQLSWTGIGTGTYEVFFGTDLSNLTSRGNVGSATTYNPGVLTPNESYFWRIDIIDGATTYTGDVWHFVTKPSTQPTDEITVMSDTSSVTSYTSVSSNDWIAHMDFDSDDLVHGHRYLIMTSGQSILGNSTGIGELFVGDAEPIFNRGVFSGNSNQKSGFHSMGVYNHIAGQNFEYKTRLSTGSTWTMHQHYMMGIDLDSPGMTEDVDWFYNHESPNVVPPSTNYTTGMSLEFTPDGYSDYLIVAHTNWYGYDVYSSIEYRDRLYDATDEVVLGYAGRHYNYLPKYDYQHGHVRSWVLEAPSATESRVIEIQIAHDSPGSHTPWKFYAGDICIIRLDKFEKYSYDQATIALSNMTQYMPPHTTYDQDPPVSRFGFDPDNKGKVMFFFTGETDPYNSSTGQAMLVRAGDEINGIGVYTTEAYPGGGAIAAAGDVITANITKDADHRVNNFCAKHISGISSNLPIYLYCADLDDRDILQRYSILTLGTKYKIPPSVSYFFPLNYEPRVPKVGQNISFNITGPDDVNLNTVNVCMSLSDGWKEHYMGIDCALSVDNNGSVWVVGGTDGKITTSLDGRNWVIQISNVSEDIHGVAYGNGIWVACGSNGTITTSSDYTTWTDRSIATTNIFYDIVYANGQFVMVGTDGDLRTSPDGINWTSRTSATSQTLFSVAHNGTNMYCAVGWHGTIITSPNGTTWTVRVKLFDEALYGVAHDQSGRWVANVAYNHHVITSIDGISWSIVETYLNKNVELHDICYGNGKWVLGGSNGVLAASTDGLKWYQTKTRFNSVIRCISYMSPDKWLTAGQTGIALISSNGGYNHVFSPVIVNGEFVNEFEGPMSIVQRLVSSDGYNDGYAISIRPDCGVLDKNQMVFIKVDADSQTGASMQTYTSQFSTDDGKLSIISKEYETYQYSNADARPILIRSSEFAPNHRYLFLVSASADAQSGNYVVYDMEFNSVSDYNLRCYYRMQNYKINHKLVAIRNIEPGMDLAIRVRTGSNAGAHNIYVQAIDLDSSLGTFKEGENWIMSIDDARKSDMDNVWTNNVGASITFTPDGVSDYLIIGGACLDNVYATSKIAQMRLYDSIDGEHGIDLFRTGTTSAIEIGLMVQTILSAPSAVERTISIQLQGDSAWDHNESTIIAIKLDSFIQKGWSRTTTTRTGYNPSPTLTTVESVNFTGDAYQEAMILGCFEQNYEIRQEIDWPVGTNICSNPRETGYAWYFDKYNGSASYHQTIFNSNVKTEIIPNETTTAIARVAAENTARNLYKSQLVVFGTELYIPPPTKAVNPDPFDGETGVSVITLLNWEAGTGTILFNVYFGTSSSLSQADFQGSQVDTSFDPPGPYLDLDTIYYWRIDSIGDGGEIEGDTWSFRVVDTFLLSTKASAPDPSDKDTDIPVEKTLSWTPGDSSIDATHNVYFGDAYGDVRDDDTSGSTFRGNFANSSFDPSTIPVNQYTNRLDSDSTYYWRIDEKNPGGVKKGDVWRFTTEYVAPPTKASLPDPGDTQTGIIPDSVLTWTPGDRSIVNRVYFSTSADPSGDLQGTQSGSVFDPPGDMSLDTTYYWKIDSIGAGGTTEGDIWSFKTLTHLPYPTNASNPLPADNAVGIRPDIILDWDTGSGIPYIGTISHDVYFGTIPNLSAGDFKGNFAPSSYNPGLLSYSETYYWRIDEVRGKDGQSLEGDVWSFTTAPIYVSQPANGDKVYDRIDIAGQTKSNVGVHIEIHAGMLIADGYTLTNANGNFSTSLLFTNQNPGVPIKLVMVTQASPDSEEVVIDLIQAREPIKDVVVRTGRRVGVDEHTAALWRLEETVVSEYPQATKVDLSFDSLPSSYGIISTNESFNPTFANSIMTTHCYSTPGIRGYIYHNVSENVVSPDDGFIVKFKFRTAKGSPFTPSESTQRLLYHRGGGIRFSVYYIDNFFKLDLVNNRIAGEYIAFDKEEWNDVEIRGINQINGDSDTCYLELYINGTLQESAFAEPYSGTEVDIGAISTDNDFTSSDWDYFKIYETVPFIECPGANIQGNSNGDLVILKGAGAVMTSTPFGNHAVCFDGSGYMENNNAILNISGSFTVEGWFKIDQSAIGNEMVLFGKQNRNVSGWCLRVGTSGKLEAVTYSGAEQVLVTNGDMSDGEWHYVVFVWDETYVYAYLDGILLNKNPQGYTENSSQPFRIGSYSESASSLFSGKAIEIRVSDIARATWDIYNIYGAVSDPQSGLNNDIFTTVAWNFDNDNIYDGYDKCISSKSSDGYFTPTTYAGDGYGTRQYRLSPIGKWARDFDGAENYVQVQHHEEWNHRDITIEIWFSADSLHNGTLLSRFNEDVNAGFLIDIASNGVISAMISDTSENTVSVRGTYQAGVWMYIAVVYDISEMNLRLYINGKEVSKNTMSASTGLHIANLPIDFGRNSSTLDRFFDGAIGSIRVSYIPRSAKQIFDEYNGSNIKEGR